MRYYVGKGYAIDLKIIQIKRKIRGISDRKRTKDIEEKRFETEWKKRQYMEEKDYEIYYYNDHNLSPVRAHSHNYYEIYFFWRATRR